MHIRSVVSFIRRWWYVLLLGPVVGGCAGYLIVQRLAWVYQASETIAVQPVTAAGGVADMQAGQALADSYAEQIHAHPVLARAAAQAGLAGLPASELDNAVQARRVTNTALLRISAQNQDPVAATELVTAVVEVFKSQIAQDEVARYTSTQDNLVALITQLQNDLDTRNQQLVTMRAAPPSADSDAQIKGLQDQVTRLQVSQDVATRNLQDVQLAVARSAGAISVIDPAVAAPDPVRPNRLLLPIAVLAGAFAGLGIALLGDHYDDHLRDPRQVLAALQLSTLSLIPRARSGVSPGASTDQRVLAAFRELRTNLLIALGDKSTPIIAIVSATHGEGKSAVAANLATALAHTGRSVILVDADLNEPSQLRIFGVGDGPGLSSLLMNDATQVLHALQVSRIPNLQLLPAGALEPANADPSALLSSTRLASVLGELRGACDVVIIDTPSVLAHPESALVSSHADMAVLVLDARRSRTGASQSALALLRTAGSTVLGVVLNRTRRGSLPVRDASLNSASRPVTRPAELAQSRAVGPVADG